MKKILLGLLGATFLTTTANATWEIHYTDFQGNPAVVGPFENEEYARANLRNFAPFNPILVDIPDVGESREVDGLEITYEPLTERPVYDQVVYHNGVRATISGTQGSEFITIRLPGFNNFERVRWNTLTNRVETPTSTTEYWTGSEWTTVAPASDAHTIWNPTTMMWDSPEPTPGTHTYGLDQTVGGGKSYQFTYNPSYHDIDVGNGRTVRSTGAGTNLTTSWGAPVVSFGWLLDNYETVTVVDANGNEGTFSRDEIESYAQSRDEDTLNNEVNSVSAELGNGPNTGASVTISVGDAVSTVSQTNIGSSIRDNGLAISHSSPSGFSESFINDRIEAAGGTRVDLNGDGNAD